LKGLGPLKGGCRIAKSGLGDNPVPCEEGAGDPKQRHLRKGRKK